MTARRPHVLIMVENLPLAIDQRLRKQVPALVAAGFEGTAARRRGWIR
jgi:hypothetical protein